MAQFAFDTPLHQQPWHLFVWGKNGYVPFVLPAIGQSLTLPAVNMGKLVGKRLKSSF
ncbi:MAG: hypothetical protein Q7U28_05515 [Aquabacterium sp.]|nr:hypothetical protein [Aquabacterium sp.]